MIRTGDTVEHIPTGEEWLVAFVDGDRLAWMGWPPGIARLSDCVLTESCSDEEFESYVRELAAAKDNDHRTLWARRFLAERAATPGG